MGIGAIIPHSLLHIRNRILWDNNKIAALRGLKHPHRVKWAPNYISDAIELKLGLAMNLGYLPD